MTLTPPENVEYGRVVWQAISDVTDGPDSGDAPDFIAPTGTVTFVPSTVVLRNNTATPNPKSIVRDVFTGILDSEGYLCTPDADNQPAYRGIELIATDDADLNPTDWTYIVTYTIKGKNGRQIPLRSHEIYVPAGTTVDLTTVGPVENATAIGIPQAEALAAQAAADAAEASVAASQALAAAEAAEAALIDSDAFVASKIDEPTSATQTALTARTLAVGDPRYARTGQITKNDAAAGILDWLNSSPTSGYLLHLRSWAGSGAGTAAIGIGTDQGNGAGLLISHKNSARGLTLSAQPGSGIGAYLAGRSTAALLYLELNSGSGPVVYQAGTSAGFADGTTTSGSPTLTSATAAFTAGDVGKAVTQVTSRGLATDPTGCIPSGTTILSVESATSVTMSQNAQATGSTVLFAVAGRTKPVGESLWESRDEASTVLAKLTKAGLNIKGGDAATPALKVTGATGATTNILEALITGNATPAINVGQNGLFTASFTSTLTNAGLVGAPPVTALTYSSHPAIALTRSGAAVGDMIQARGSGSTALSRINRDGFIMTAKNAAPADADLNAGEIAFWFDSTNGAAKLKVKAKEAGGTVRTGEVALA